MKRLLFFLVLFASASTAFAVSQTLTGSGGTSITFTLANGSLSISGSAHDYNSADYSSDNTTWTAFSAIPASVSFSSPTAYIRISRSGSVLASGQLGNPAEYKVTFAIPANNTDHGLTYVAMQGGVEVGMTIQDPGSAAREWTLTGLTSNAIVTLHEKTNNMTQDANGFFVWDSGGTYVREVNGGTNPVPTSGANNTPGTTTSPTATGTGTGNTAPAPTNTTTPSGVKPVWKPLPQDTSGGTGNPTPGSPTGGVTNEVFREGVEKIIAGSSTASNATTTAVNNGTNVVAGKLDTVAAQVGNVNTSLGAVNGQLTTLNGTAATIANNTAQTKSSVDAVKTSIDSLVETQGLLAKESAQKAAADTYNSAKAAGQAAKGSAEGGVSGVAAHWSVGNAPSGGGSSMTVSWPGVATIDLDPLSDDSVASLCSWIKSGIAWLAVGLFEWWLWTQLRTHYFALAATPQARGNAVFAGTGAQATALIAAGALVAILVSFPAAFWALTQSGVFGGVSSPLDSLPGVTGRLASALLPLTTIVAVIAQAFVVQKAGLVLYAGAAAVTKFVVP